MSSAIQRLPLRRYVSYWMLPVIAGTVWLGMLLGMLLHWIVNTNRERYSSEDATQNIAYISDVGAAELKPLFITGCVLTTLFLDLSFAADRWLRHKGRLVPNQSRLEKILSWGTIGFAIIGTAGLILLSIFDTARHPKLHDIFLLFFIAGYTISAILICWEYQRLGIHHREHRILRISFWVKLTFSLLTIALAIGFVICTFKAVYNPGAVLEWAIAFLFSLYVFSFVIDLWPAMNTRNGGNYLTKTGGTTSSMGTPHTNREKNMEAGMSDGRMTIEDERLSGVTQTDAEMPQGQRVADTWHGGHQTTEPQHSH